jgi:hypothetical protein
MMSGSRPSIFDSNDAGSGIDLSDFAPKTDAAMPPVPPETRSRCRRRTGSSRAPRRAQAHGRNRRNGRCFGKSGRTVLLNARLRTRA